MLSAQHQAGFCIEDNMTDNDTALALPDSHQFDLLHRTDRELVELSEVSREQVLALVEIAETIDALRDISARAAAIVQWLKIKVHTNDLRVEACNNVLVGLIDADRKAGKFLAEMDKQHGARGINQYDAGSRFNTPREQPTLAEMGLDKNKSRTLQNMAALPDDKVAEAIADAQENGRIITPSAIAAHGKNYRKKQERNARSGIVYTAERATIQLADWCDFLIRQPRCELLLTDPPYMTDVENIQQFAHTWLPIALEKVKPTGRAYVCIGAYPDELSAYLGAPRANMELAQVLVWTYRNTLGPAPKLNYKQNWQAILYFRGHDAPPLDCPELNELFSVQDINAPDGRLGNRYHEWQKPDELGERLIRHSTKPGALVLDPFAGTGTFILAAARLGRIGQGCDASERMIALAKGRGCYVVGD